MYIEKQNFKELGIIRHCQELDALFLKRQDLADAGIDFGEERTEDFLSRVNDSIEHYVIDENHDTDYEGHHDAEVFDNAYYRKSLADRAYDMLRELVGQKNSLYQFVTDEKESKFLNV